MTPEELFIRYQMLLRQSCRSAAFCLAERVSLLARGEAADSRLEMDSILIRAAMISARRLFLVNVFTAVVSTRGRFALDILACSPATANHVSFQLAQYFVAADPSPELVQRMTRSYLATGGNLRAGCCRPCFSVLNSGSSAITG
jgi:hypothetical protein